MKAVADVVFEAKKQVVKDFAAFLAEKIDFDDDMKGYFEEFEKTIVKETKTVPSKKKGSSGSDSSEKKKRTPSAYNMFISEKMGEIKKVRPELKGKELMKAAIEAWNENKEKNADAAKAVEAEESVEPEETDETAEPEPESGSDTEVEKPTATKATSKKNKK